jgi:hypothetical protein
MSDPLRTEGQFDMKDQRLYDAARAERRSAPDSYLARMVASAAMGRRPSG